jgi:hypothetical protein
MLLPLPAERFDTVGLLQARVDTKARISVRQNHYSVPVRFAGRRLSVIARWAGISRRRATRAVRGLPA